MYGGRQALYQKRRERKPEEDRNGFEGSRDFINYPKESQAWLHILGARSHFSLPDPHWLAIHLTLTPMGLPAFYKDVYEDIS
ncbi:hypothetical protein N0V93_000812 [Gnomoniopsis smithogilvyi]|uniref:Uncharacterized protein n=1 Tax=Gnomoniopsis smithogilvyi TaxID=1191159 RepID=A0A9W9D248_9PEZI|nr:hypothetical protein N0V93_000812 [Gnomoniopsis smithogilvyi]